MNKSTLEWRNCRQLTQRKTGDQRRDGWTTAGTSPTKLGCHQLLLQKTWYNRKNNENYYIDVGDLYPSQRLEEGCRWSAYLDSLPRYWEEKLNFQRQDDRSRYLQLIVVDKELGTFVRLKIYKRFWWSDYVSKDQVTIFHIAARSYPVQKVRGHKIICTSVVRFNF